MEEIRAESIHIFNSSLGSHPEIMPGIAEPSAGSGKVYKLLRKTFRWFLVTTWCVAAIGGLDAAWAQTINKDYLRHDETLAYDAITFKFAGACRSISDSRTLALGFDAIQFKDAGGTTVGSVDVGTASSSYWLGQGWHGSEMWVPTGMAWTNGNVAESTVYFPLPSTTQSLEFLVILPNCVSTAGISTEVLINGYTIGQFTVTDSGWQTLRLQVPQPLVSSLEYRLIAGGPASLSAIDWLNDQGSTIASTSTPATLATAGERRSFAIQRPSGAGDFCVRFGSAVQAVSQLRVGVNRASALIVTVPTGATLACSTEKDALERQADRRTRVDGWSEDFNERNGFRITGDPQISSNGDSAEILLTVTANTDSNISIAPPEPFSILSYPYLSLKIKVSLGASYHILPYGLDSAGNRVEFYAEPLPILYRPGKGEWEILTISVPRLLQMIEKNGRALTDVTLSLMRKPGQLGLASLEIDWIAIHKSFLPNLEDRTPMEVDFSNHLDDDGDGLTDKDDVMDRTGSGFDRPLVLAYYHPWYGSRLSTTGFWSGWNGQLMDFSDVTQAPKPMGVIYDPEKFDPLFPGKRVLSTKYYPLNARTCSDYSPPKDGKYRYDLCGGVEINDNLNPEFVLGTIRLAGQYGIDGFLSDTGGIGSLQRQLEIGLDSAGKESQPFWISANYDWFYRYPPFGLFEEKPDYAMALDLRHFFTSYGSHPRWLQYGSLPVITAPFRADTVAASKWTRVTEVAADPGLSDFDGRVDIRARQTGFANRIVFKFAKAEQPTSGDTRYLSVRFDYIDFFDAKLNKLSRFDFGTPTVRAHLISGWSIDEVDPSGSWVWAAGTQREAVAEVEIPEAAQIMAMVCYSLPRDNTMIMSINGGTPVTLSVPTSTRTFLLRLAGVGSVKTSSKERPFALFLQNKEAADLFDGYITYGNFPTSNYFMISDPKPGIATVAVGYDDRRLRFPGYYVDRENGALYRRNWEAALRSQPDVVVINTWNEWEEGTNIEPSVEFGYQYLELTLTYSLIFKGKVAVNPKPSEIDFIVTKYQLSANGASEISFRAAKEGTVTFKDIPLDLMRRLQVSRNGQPLNGMTTDPASASLTIRTSEGPAEYRLDFPNVPEAQLYLPFFYENSDFFNGIAVSNSSAQSADIELVGYKSDGKALSVPKNPVSFSLPAGTQLAKLGFELFSADSTLERSGWMEMNTNNASIGSFFIFGGNGQMDGSVALTGQFRRAYFTRVYEGQKVFQGKNASTSLSLANPNYQAVKVKLRLVGSQGNAAPQEKTITLSPKARLYDTVAGLFGPGISVSMGYIAVEVMEGDGVVGFALVHAPEPPAMIGLNTITPDVSTVAYSAQLAYGLGLFTSVKLINTSNQERRLRLTAIDDLGRNLASPVSATLPASGWLQQDVAQLFGWNPGLSVVGTLRVESDGPGIIGDVVFGEAARLAFAAALPLQTTTFTQAVFSHVANGSGYFTGIALHNPSVQTAVVTIEVFTSEGRKVGERQLQLAAGARISKLLIELVPSSNDQLGGYVFIRSNQPLVGQQLFANADSLVAVPPSVAR